MRQWNIRGQNPARRSLLRQSANEKRRIQYLQARLTELCKQKENVLRISNPALKPGPGLTRAPSPLTEPEAQEEMFWNTPAASVRLLCLVGKSMDDPEEVNIDDESVMSFMSPVPWIRSVLSFLDLILGRASLIIDA